MKTILILLFAVITISSFGQMTIQGCVTDKKNQPVIGANIYFERTYDGTTSDLEGRFKLNTEDSKPLVLKVSCMGYETYSCLLAPGQSPQNLMVVLVEKINELDAVVISAGTFEVSEKKQSLALTAFDIASTASAQGDIYGALNALPGSQHVGEEGRLFVRGGESYETKTYMDGMQVQSPYFANVPNIPTRGRFSPLLFEGLLFSSGGYSAEYGQALSSIVALKTTGLETTPKRSLTLMTVGTGFSEVATWNRSSLGITGDYINSALHNTLFKPSIAWNRTPQSLNSTFMFRHKSGESGLLKMFAAFNLNGMNLLYDNVKAQKFENLSLTDQNIHLNTSYTDMLNEKWMLQTGLAYTLDNDDLLLEDMPVKTTLQAHHLRLKLTNLTTASFSWKTGAEWLTDFYHQKIGHTNAERLAVNNHQLALFIEGEWSITPKLGVRLGARSEYSTLLQSHRLTPRLAAAVKTGKNSQVSMAIGTFIQNPLNDYLKINPNLQPEEAFHALINYQYKYQKKSFRIEAYQKKYNKLVTYQMAYSMDALDYGNNGYGFARGIDLFWRDQESFKNTDCWVTYSYNHTERLYGNYPQRVVPSYASAHNLSIVWKRFFPEISTFLGATLSMASGRPYNDPNQPEFMNSRTPLYQDISFSATYLTQLFNKEAILHLMVNNALGCTNVFGYEYADEPNDFGQYIYKPITSPINRQAVLVLVLML